MRNNFTLFIEIIDNPQWMGGTIYLSNLVRCLFRIPKNQRPDIHILGNNKLAHDFRRQFSKKSFYQTYVYKLRSFFVWLLCKLRLSYPKFSILYPGFSDYPNTVKLAWIPDLQHCVLPNLFDSSEIQRRNSSILSLSNPKQFIVFSSESARSDFKKFFPDHKAVTRVCHFHTLLDQSLFKSCDTSIIADLGLPSKYLYLPNQFWAHKNHLFVLQALLDLKLNHNLVIPLVLTGQPSDNRNSSHYSSLINFIEEYNLSSQIFNLGLIPWYVQLQVFRHVVAIIQPSFEGWSTVVEDTVRSEEPSFF